MVKEVKSAVWCSDLVPGSYTIKKFHFDLIANVDTDIEDLGDDDTVFTQETAPATTFTEETEPADAFEQSLDSTDFIGDEVPEGT